MKRYFLLALVLGCNTLCYAKTKPLTESLLNCDSQFFSDLYTQRASLKNTAPLKTDNQHHAWFVVPDKGDKTAWFGQPLRVGALTVLGYNSEVTDLKELGRYYLWGFVIEQSPEAVVAVLSSVHWGKMSDGYVANAMIKRSGGSWQINPTAVGGIAPAKGSVEKVTMIGTSDGKTTLLCSIQGSVTDEVLLPFRPDLRKGEK